jgi:hypothetical protein
MALLASVPVVAQDEWAGQVQKMMDNAAKKLADSGFSYGGYSHSGSLDDDASERLTLRLGTQSSQLVALCDGDCSDIDLVLYDDDGDKVDEDTQLDDYPVVSVSPSKNAVYTLVVRMAGCSSEPCRYAVQQFVK